MVVVEAHLKGEEVVWTQQRLLGGVGFGGNHDKRMFFGLGEVEQVSIEVTWPDGEVTVISAVETNQAFTITRE